MIPGLSFLTFKTKTIKELITLLGGLNTKTPRLGWEETLEKSLLLFFNAGHFFVFIEIFLQYCFCSMIWGVGGWP